MTLVQCDYRRHAQPILAIFNEAIVHSTALYDYKPRTTEKMVTWFENKRKGKFPVIGVENEAGELMGFASYGIFRAWPAYKYTVEHSVYVDGRFRGRGIGKRLLQEIVAAAQACMRAALDGTLSPEALTEQMFNDQLYTAGMPDPDLVIRTSGERRVSNFLLWQAAYAEYLFPEVLWPDFSAAHFDAALADFATRDRRYGARP